jgi:hypothetical protein
VTYATFLVGPALSIALIARQGVSDTAKALSTAGWGLVWVALFHLIPIATDVMAWPSLVAAHARLPRRTGLLASWVGESVNGLLPLMQVGGSVGKHATHIGEAVRGAAERAEAPLGGAGRPTDFSRMAQVSGLGGAGLRVGRDAGRQRREPKGETAASRPPEPFDSPRHAD